MIFRIKTLAPAALAAVLAASAHAGGPFSFEPLGASAPVGSLSACAPLTLPEGFSQAVPQVGPDGNVYVGDELNGGSIFRFVPDQYGDLSTGTLYALNVPGLIAVGGRISPPQNARLMPSTGPYCRTS